jgi:hypothetical protein
VSVTPRVIVLMTDKVRDTSHAIGWFDGFNCHGLACDSIGLSF